MRARLQNWWGKLRSWLLALIPDAAAQAMIAWALLGGAVFALLVGVVSFELNAPGWLIVLVSLPLAAGIVWLARFVLQPVVEGVQRLPAPLLVSGIVAFAAFSWASGLSTAVVWPLVAGALLTLIALGGAVAALRGGTRRGVAIAYIVFALAVLAVDGVVVWQLHAPQPDPLAHLVSVAHPSQIDAPNPALPGEFAVDTLSYGSGNDRWRSAYGPDATILTVPVDGSGYVSYDEWEGRLRAWYWGFDRKALPLNALVWAPRGDGPFPLVMIAHGNHSMTEFSEPGYAYLGGLLASRGYIVVSVDENFLNGGVLGAASGENDARAWLLLEHLDQWARWNTDPESGFYQQVDMSRIALIGHSRGGEAVALAAAFNQLGRNPNNAITRWHYDHAIKAVIALAPVDGQHQPGGSPVALADVHYLVLQGAADADVSSFYGLRQYQRVAFSPDSEAFKAALYIHRANHGQFNTVWGARDLRAPRGWLLNTANLLEGDAQREITSMMISALLEVVLKGDARYQPLFADPALAGDWLPPALYNSQYGDGGTWIVADFEEDVDVLTSTAGARVTASGLNRWREVNLPLRGNNRQENTAVELGWRTGRGRYQLALPAGFAATEGQLLVFNAGNADDEDVQLLDFSVTLTDAVGETATVILGDFRPLLPQFPYTFSLYTPWAAPRYPDASQPVLQSYRLPLADFMADNPALDVSAIRQIAFLFDQTEEGRVYLDDIGFDD